MISLYLYCQGGDNSNEEQIFFRYVFMSDNLGQQVINTLWCFIIKIITFEPSLPALLNTLKSSSWNNLIYPREVNTEFVEL